MAIGLIGLLGLGGYHAQRYFYTPAERLILDAALDRDPQYRCGQLFRIQHPFHLTCALTPGSPSGKRILFVGNSHADALKQTFAHLAQQQGVGVYFLVPNNPLMKNSSITPAILLQEATRYPIHHIILHYDDGHAVPLPTLITMLQFAAQQTPPLPISFIMPVPIYTQSIPKALWAHAQHQAPLPRQTKSEYLQQHQAFYQILSTLQATFPGFQKYEVVDYFCQPQCALVDLSGKPLYFDSDHLTLTGSHQLLGLFTSLLNDINNK